MQTYPIPAHSLDTAQKYSETAGSLAEALHNLFLRRPYIRTDPSNPGAQAAYYRAVGAWYMENSNLLSAGLAACRLLSDGAALELENVREAAESPAEPPSAGGNGPNAAGQASSLPDPQNRENAARSTAPAGTGANPQAPGSVLFYRQALINQPEHPRKKKGHAGKGAGV